MNKGFTMVELLVVITILSIIIIIAVPAYNRINRSIKENNLETTISFIGNSLLEYANRYLIDDIKPSNNTCVEEGNHCCTYYSIDYITKNNIFQTSEELIDPTSNRKLEGYFLLTYNIETYSLEVAYSAQANNTNCKVVEE